MELFIRASALFRARDPNHPQADELPALLEAFAAPAARGDAQLQAAMAELRARLHGAGFTRRRLTEIFARSTQTMSLFGGTTRRTLGTWGGPEMLSHSVAIEAAVAAEEGEGLSWLQPMRAPGAPSQLAVATW